jgi:hypothetical protein
MKFPSFFLEQKKRPILEGDIFKDFHFMYARHKPGHDWNIEEGIPDFSKIKLKDQSFNWSIYSIPIWTRFNDKKEYLDNYAVVGFSVDTICHTSLWSTEFKDSTLGLEHKPIELNYSHCQLKLNIQNLSNFEKRNLRVILKNKSYVPLYPRESQSSYKILFDIIKMIISRYVNL